MNYIFDYVVNFIKDIFKPSITFYSKVPFLLEANLPTEVKKEFSENIKKTLPSIGKYQINTISVKKCPGVIEYAKSGYIIRAWQNIAITTDSDGESYKWEAENLSHFHNGDRINKIIDHFPPDMYFDAFPRKNTLRTILKINTPWHIKVPKGYKILFVPVWYDNEERFTAVPGILDPELNDHIKVIIYWHSLGKTEVIKTGTPLVRLIPFKSEKWNTYLEEASDDIIKESDAKIIRNYNGPLSEF